MSWAEAIKTSNTVKLALQASKAEIITNTDDEAKLTNDYLLAMILLDGSNFDNFVAQDKLLLKRLIENEEIKKDPRVIGKILDAITAVGNPILERGEQGEVLFYLTGDDYFITTFNNNSSAWIVYSTSKFWENVVKEGNEHLVDGVINSSQLSANLIANWSNSHIVRSEWAHYSQKIMQFVYGKNIAKFEAYLRSEDVDDMILKMRHSYDDMCWIIKNSIMLAFIATVPKVLARFIVCSKETPVVGYSNIRNDFRSFISSSADLSVGTLTGTMSSSAGSSTYFERPNYWSDTSVGATYAPNFRLYNSSYTGTSGGQFNDSLLPTIESDYSVISIYNFGSGAGFPVDLRMVERYENGGTIPVYHSSGGYNFGSFDDAIIGGVIISTQDYSPTYLRWKAYLHKVKDSVVQELLN